MTLAHRFSARHFHPELRTAARLLPSSPVGRRTLPVVRAALHRMGGGEEVSVAQVNETVTVRIHQPPAASRSGAAVLWIHGGGLVMGTPRLDDRRCRRIADETGAVVAAVAYRVAPEHRYPAALDDCMAALAWLARQPDIDPRRIAVAGASAGGGLAAAVALRARDEGGVLPRFQLLVYPMLDDRTASRPDPRPAVRRMWNNRANHFGWSSYLGQEPGAPDISPHAAPARCTDFRGLSPAWIGVGTNDLFFDEAVGYARQLQDAGIPCTLEIVEGAFHIFERAGVQRPVVAQWYGRQMDAIATALKIA